MAVPRLRGVGRVRGRLRRERTLRGPFTVALRARLTRHKAGSALSPTRGEADAATHRVNPKARRYDKAAPRVKRRSRAQTPQ
jgi:hypothetical protein